MTVWIAQCLCPSRHALLAAAGEADDESAAMRDVRDPLRFAVAGALGSRVFNPWCGLCHADAETWSFELARTRYRTMAEAAPELQRLQDEQAVTRAVFGDMKRSD